MYGLMAAVALVSVLSMPLWLRRLDMVVLQYAVTAAVAAVGTGWLCWLAWRERQAELVRIGASKTMFSRHLTGHAVDIAPIIAGEICWKWAAFTPVIEAMRRASKDLGIMVIHGADWKSFPDGPHHELDRRYFA